MEEQMKDIKDYEGLYQVSNLGTVYSVKSGKFLKPYSNKKGYVQVRLYKNKKSKDYSVHRLVANTFIPNPLQLPQVNHKDENPSNNHVENLEFCTASYNVNYGTRIERVMQHPNYKASHKKQSKPVLQFTKQGEFVKEFPSVNEAHRQTKINPSHISECCKNKLKSAGNYIWRYKQKEEDAV